MKRTSAVLVGVIMTFGAMSAVAASEPGNLAETQLWSGMLDGTSWQVNFTPSSEGAGPAFQDTFIFKSGIVTVKADAARGFSPEEYDFSTWDSSTTFSMIQAARGGKKIYRGWVDDKGRMGGTLTWQRDLGSQRYEFKGTRAKTQKSAGARKPAKS